MKIYRSNTAAHSDHVEMIQGMLNHYVEDAVTKVMYAKNLSGEVRWVEYLLTEEQNDEVEAMVSGGTDPITLEDCWVGSRGI